MTAQAEAFVALHTAAPDSFTAVRELVADLCTTRDAFVNDLDRLSDRGKAAFATLDAKADAAVYALKAIDAPEDLAPDE